MRDKPLLSVTGLSVAYQSRVDGTPVEALRGVDLTLDKGDSVGIAGESGSGKSTLALALLGLLPKGTGVAGRVEFEGVDLLTAPDSHLRSIRGRRVGIVFQNPQATLNPVLSIERQIIEPLTYRGVDRGEAVKRAVRMLERVGIADAPRRIRRYPHEFSGGMQQRVVIAMAMICDPALLLADEPTTALDVRVQAQVLDLIAELATEFGMALIIITHDLAVLAGHTERVCIMYAGRIVETQDTAGIFKTPSHPYAEGLIKSAPRIDSVIGDELPVIPGQPPMVGRLPTGCPFHPRCAYKGEECATIEPPLVGSAKKASACWYPRS